MKYRILSLLLASSLTGGNFTLPVDSSPLMEKTAEPFTGSQEEALPHSDADLDIAAGSLRESGTEDVFEEPGPEYPEYPEDTDFGLFLEDDSEDLLESGFGNLDEPPASVGNLSIPEVNEFVEGADLQSFTADSLSGDLDLDLDAEDILYSEDLNIPERVDSAEDNPDVSGESLLPDRGEQETVEFSTLTEEEEDLLDEAEAEGGAEDAGGYEYAGLLPDGVPNFVWTGEGSPASLEDLLEPKQTGAVFRSAPGSGGNYIADTLRRDVYHSYKRMSETAESGVSDGLHTMSDGAVRAYKGGKYFIDGAFALDGVLYYADTDGTLVSGWLKTLQKSAANSGMTDWNTVMNDMFFDYRYYDKTSFEQQQGLKTVDGLPHFFNEHGLLTLNKAVIAEGNYSFCNRYGICDKVKLRYGNVLTSEEQQNNDAYYANRSVNAVDINTFDGQNGEYSFRPKWQDGVTSLELFGFEPIADSKGRYCALTDDSLKGKIGCIYRNVGKYQGRTIDLRITVMDYEFFSLAGDIETGYFYVFDNIIGVNASNTRSITADMSFWDHETGNPVSLKGYATFSDIDIGQSVEILSPVEEVFVDRNCVLYKDPNRLSFTSPFTTNRVGSLVTDENSENWVQVNYTGTHLEFRFCTAFEEYVFAETGLDISGEARMVWNKTYTGNAADYYIMKADGSLYQSWQGLHFKRLGRISIPGIFKTVSDTDEKDVTDNRLTDDEMEYTYTLSHNVPAESEDFYYSSYRVTDVFEDWLLVTRAGIAVKTDDGADVTDRFDINVTGQKVEFSASASWLTNDAFYDNNYNYIIPVKIRDVESIGRKDGNDYLIFNSCTAEFDRNTGPEKSESNQTTTRIRQPVCYGSILITKKVLENDIVWAHGNPTFLFHAEGSDARGVSHAYETYVCFSRGGYETDGAGYAVLSTVISHVPLGTYRVEELDVIDYYLTGAEAQTGNMTITAVGEPGRGKSPSEVAYGTGVLTAEAPDTGITFIDAKGDYHGYRHTDIVTNNIPIALS